MPNLLRNILAILAGIVIGGAVNMAIDRKAVIQGAGDGYGVPIGSSKGPAGRPDPS